MNEELVKFQLEKHEIRLNAHSERLDKLDTKQAETNIKLDNLCKSIDSLTSTIKWLMGLMITSLGGFFIWAIQQNLF